MVFLIICLLVFGFCIAGVKFFERLFGLLVGALLGLIILVFVLGKVIGIF